MRKLLTSKKSNLEHEKLNTGYTRQPRKQPIQQRKLTVTSNWCTRNDSSNISGILDPDKYLTTPQQLRESKHDKTSNKTKGVQKKCLLNGNNCYCRSKAIKPKLLQKKQKKRIPQEDFNENLSRTCLPEFFESTKAVPESTKHYNSVNSQYLKEATERTRHTIHSKFLNKAYHEDSESKSGYMDFVHCPNDYEAFGDGQNDYHSRIRRFLDEEAEEEKGNLNNGSVFTIMASKPIESQKGSSFYSQDSQEPSQSIEDLKQFRDEHYFETHNTDNLAKDIPEHVCVHQFQLDNRLLPEPINMDLYGMSRCKICYQPMENETLSEGSNVKNLVRCSQMGLSPRRICMCGDKSQIELKLKQKELEQYKGFVGRIRRPEYVNTFALRQQKMTC